MKKHSDTNGQIQEKMLKYYISKSKRNNVCNIVRISHKHKFICTPVSMGSVADKVALGHFFHSQYHSIKDRYSFIHLLPALYNLN